MTLSMDPELAAVFAASAGDTPPEPLVPGDWKTWREAVATVYPQITAGLQRSEAGHQVFTATAADGARIELHWFTPVTPATGLTAAVVHAHGGALVAGQVDHFEPFLARYVATSGVPLLSVDYRLAPEATGSTPADDVFLALTWLREHAGELGVDPARIAVMGESAGGTLAAATAIRARDEGIELACQILLYPLLDNHEVAPDPQRVAFSADLYTLKITQWRSLLGDAWSGEAPATIVPARLTDHTRLAPAYLEVGELDALRDETVDYAQRLWAAGVSTELHVLPGLTHGWDHFAPSITVHADVYARRIAVLQAL